MKNFVRYALALVSVALVTGCAGTLKMLPDGRYLSSTTVGDTLDRSASYVQLLETTGEKNPDGSQRFKQVAGEMSIGPTIPGQVLVGATNGIGTAFVNQRTAIRVAKENACNGPNCGNGSIIVNNVKSEAGALSNSQSGVDFDALFQSTCPSGACGQ